MAEDWYLNCRKLDFSTLPDKKTLPPTLEDVRHIILMPVVNEPEGVLRDSINSIFNQTFPISQISLVFTIEQNIPRKLLSELKILSEQEIKN
jgi:cellulose synthase/poly-beta-1,6-N-acetylglucosamine synthase-like glycosyltransferase